MGRSLIWATASLFFGLVLSSLHWEDRVPLAVLLFLFGTAALAAWRPAAALMLLAVLVPIASWGARYWNGAVAWPETLVVAFLAGYAMRRARSGESGPPSSLVVAVGALIAVVVGSLAVRLLVLRATLSGEVADAYLWNVLTTRYFTDRGSVALDAAMRMIEGALLLHAGASTARSEHSAAPRVIRALVFGAAAAGALNVWRIWLGALRLESPVAAFLTYLRTLRYNALYSDVNAAGSYFVMMLLPGLAASVGRRRVLWAAAVLFIGASLVLSGSRAAVVAGVAAALGLAVCAFASGTSAWWWTRRRSLLVGALIAAVVLSGSFLLIVRNATPAQASLWIRVEFARTALQMFRSAPLFGVGIGEYFSRSGEFASSELRKSYPLENAHNNFLQVLSELGIIGLAVFLWVLGAAGAASGRNLARDPRNLLRWAGAAGALAFVITWLGGHPLLVDSPGFSFWLLLGTLAGWGHLERARTRSATRAALLVAALIATTAGSVPLRYRGELARAELEHQGIGLSGWRDGSDGVSYRVAGARSTVFVPAAARGVAIPLRAAVPGAELLIELRLDGRPADVRRVPSDRWLTVRLPLPSSNTDVRYRRLDLEVRALQTGDDPVLMIGKVTPL